MGSGSFGLKPITKDAQATSRADADPQGGLGRSRSQQILLRLWQRPQNFEFAPQQAARMVAAVGIGPLGLPGMNLSGSAAVRWVTV
ncbi:MAG: hypothetical protein GQ571_00145 [Desulfobacterales bacterium]|nr:hypothetical protein [Desulfobacterales bacterium]